MRKHTLGEHYDAWSRFARWYWKYTLSPRIFNPFRKLRYWLWGRGVARENKSKRFGSPIFSKVFYGDGQLLPMDGPVVRIINIGDEKNIMKRRGAFKDWWFKQSRKQEHKKRRELIARHVRDLRKLLDVKKHPKK